MKCVADECVDRAIVRRLIADDHEIISIADLMRGADDDTVLAHAAEAGTLLLTEDKDFGELVFHQHRQHLGVVLIRLSGLSSGAKAGLVSAVMQQHGQEMRAKFTVISPAGVRIRVG